MNLRFTIYDWRLSRAMVVARASRLCVLVNRGGNKFETHGRDARATYWQ
jgi:hypothetical protein